jgi:hypothetical protein
VPLLFCLLGRPESRIPAAQGASLAVNFLQKQQKQRELLE